MSNFVREANTTQFSECEVSVTNDADSNFATNSFYGKKKSAKHVDILCEVSGDNIVDISNIQNDSFQDICKFDPKYCSSFIEDSENGATGNLDTTTVRGLILDGVTDMNISVKKRKRPDVTYNENDAEMSDSGSDTEFVPVHKKPKKHLKSEPPKGYKKNLGGLLVLQIKIRKLYL